MLIVSDNKLKKSQFYLRLFILEILLNQLMSKRGKNSKKNKVKTQTNQDQIEQKPTIIQEPKVETLPIDQKTLQNLPVLSQEKKQQKTDQLADIQKLEQTIDNSIEKDIQKQVKQLGQVQDVSTIQNQPQFDGSKQNTIQNNVDNIKNINQLPKDTKDQEIIEKPEQIIKIQQNEDKTNIVKEIQISQGWIRQKNQEDITAQDIIKQRKKKNEQKKQLELQKTKIEQFSNIEAGTISNQQILVDQVIKPTYQQREKELKQQNIQPIQQDLSALKKVQQPDQQKSQAKQSQMVKQNLQINEQQNRQNQQQNNKKQEFQSKKEQTNIQQKNDDLIFLKSEEINVNGGQFSQPIILNEVVQNQQNNVQNEVVQNQQNIILNEVVQNQQNNVQNEVVQNQQNNVLNEVVQNQQNNVQKQVQNLEANSVQIKKIQQVKQNQNLQAVSAQIQKFEQVEVIPKIQEQKLQSQVKEGDQMENNKVEELVKTEQTVVIQDYKQNKEQHIKINKQVSNEQKLQKQENQLDIIEIRSSLNSQPILLCDSINSQINEQKEPIYQKIQENSQFDNIVKQKEQTNLQGAELKKNEQTEKNNQEEEEQKSLLLEWQKIERQREQESIRKKEMREKEEIEEREQREKRERREQQELDKWIAQKQRKVELIKQQQKLKRQMENEKSIGFKLGVSGVLSILGAAGIFYFSQNRRYAAMTSVGLFCSSFFLQ